MNSHNQLAAELNALQKKTERLEARVRHTRLISAGLLLIALFLISVAFSTVQHPGIQEDGVLTVRGIVIIDERGVPRVQIGAPLPDPPVLGKRINRGGTANGILLFDREGNERGGYVTFDESGLVMLSLDEVGHMAAQFGAGPVGGARLWMRNRKSENLRLGVNANGIYAEGLPANASKAEEAK